MHQFQFQIGQQPALAPLLLMQQLAHDLAQRVSGRRDPEVLGGGIFDAVGLVQNNAGKGGQYGRAGKVAQFLFHGDVGKEHVMVDDKQVRPGHVPARAGQETVVEMPATRAGAQVGLAVDPLPQDAVGHEMQVRAAAVARSLGPFRDGPQLTGVLLVVKQTDL